MNHLKKNYLAGLILIFAIVGLIVSFILTIEYLEILKNPDAALSCNLNSVINCASVMKSNESHILGFPNPLMGLVYYTGVAIIALVILTQGFVNRKLLYLVLLTSIGGFIFSYWLLFSSLFRIKALCPYCVISCFSATTIFFSMLAFLLKDKFGPKSKKWVLPLIALFYLVVTGIVVLTINSYSVV